MGTKKEKVDEIKMSKEKEIKNGTNDAIYDECNDCNEMFVITQCPKCKKWFYNRCWEDHYCSIVDII